jgi:hypothetical protein
MLKKLIFLLILMIIILGSSSLGYLKYKESDIGQINKSIEEKIEQAGDPNKFFGINNCNQVNTKLISGIIINLVDNIIKVKGQEGEEIKILTKNNTLFISENINKKEDGLNYGIIKLNNLKLGDSVVIISYQETENQYIGMVVKKLIY